MWAKSDLSFPYLTITDSDVGGGNRSIAAIKDFCPQINLNNSNFYTTRTLSKPQKVIQVGLEHDESTDWSSAETGLVVGDIRQNDGWMFKCHDAHNAAAATEPDVGADWKTVWEVWEDIQITAIGCTFEQRNRTDEHCFCAFYGTKFYVDSCSCDGGNAGFSLKAPSGTIKNSSATTTDPCSLHSRTGGSVSNCYFKALASGSTGKTALNLTKNGSESSSHFPDRRVNNNILITEGGSVADRAAFESDYSIGNFYCDKNIYFNLESSLLTKLGGAEKTTIAASQAFYEAQTHAYTQNDQNSKKMSSSVQGLFIDMGGNGIKEWVGVPQKEKEGSSYNSVDGGGYTHTN